MVALVLSLGMCKKLYDQNIVLKSVKPSVNTVTRTERVYVDGKVSKEVIVKEVENKSAIEMPKSQSRNRYVEVSGNQELRQSIVGLGLSFKNTYDIGYSFQPDRKTHRLALRYRF